MRTALITLTLIAAMLFSSICRADDSPALSEGSALVVHNGARGVWFPMEIANRMLLELQEHASWRVQMPLLTGQLTLERETAGRWKTQFELTAQQSEIYRKALNDSLAVVERTSHWWESSEMMYFLGFVSAGVLAVGLSFGLDAGN